MSKVYALWLPLNKDFFGFDNYWEVDLNIFESIYKDKYHIEYPIFLRSKEILEKKIIKNKFVKEISCSYDCVTKCDGDEHTRVICFEIHQNNEEIGCFKIFSNGLYLWKFNIEVTREEFKKHLSNLFDTNIIENIEREKKDYENENIFEQYNGILNYFQLELLQDILYNIHVAPSVFFKTRKDKEQNKSFEEKINKHFTLTNILNAIILEQTTDNKLEPFSKREIYPLDNKKYTHYFSNTLEHFIRVSNTFSLEHYRRGLQYCLKNLSEIGNFRTDISDANIDYNLPSILGHKASMMKLESYHTMIYEKLPHLKYLNSLYIGLESTHIRGKVNSLHQAIKQNSRRVQTISDIFYSIEKLIELENTKNIHYEIAELRKNNEINNQLSFGNDNQNIEEIKSLIDYNDSKIKSSNSKFTSWLGIYTLLLTFTTVVIPFITTNDINIYDNVKNNIYIIEFMMWLFASFGVLLYGYINRLKYSNIQLKSSSKNKYPSLYVFDNSNIDVKEQVKGKYEDIIEIFGGEKLSVSLTEMPSLLSKNKKVNCLKFDSIRERYRSYKLYKFTFLSDFENENNRLQYTLDLDIQYDTVGEKDTKIKNIRIAIIDKQNISKDDLIKAYKNMHNIKEGIVKELLKELNKS